VAGIDASFNLDLLLFAHWFVIWKWSLATALHFRICLTWDMMNKPCKVAVWTFFKLRSWLRWNGFVRKSRQLMYLRGVSNLTRFKLSWHLVVSKQWQTLFSGNIECVNLKMDRRTLILFSTLYIDFIFYLIVLTVNVLYPVSALIMQNLHYGRATTNLILDNLKYKKKTELADGSLNQDKHCVLRSNSSLGWVEKSMLMIHADRLVINVMRVLMLRLMTK